MEENRYISELLTVAKLTGRINSSTFNRQGLLDLALDVNEHAYDMSDARTRQFFSGYLASKNVFEPDEIAKTIEAGRVNGKFIMLSEIENIFNGVSLHVKDAGLVEALIRTDIDALAGDVKFPFPVMEICLPGGVDIGSGYQAAGMILIDYKLANFREKYAGLLNFSPRPDGTSPASFICLVRPKRIDGTQGESVLIKKFDESLDLNMGDIPPDLDGNDIAIIGKQTKLAMALMLYLQSIETGKGISPMPYSYSMGMGLPALVAKKQKTRKHYSIIDIVAPKRSSAYVPQGGHHASPITHWRKGFMRILRHDKYGRKPDGSFRTTWLRPVKIGEGDTRGDRSVSKKEGSVDPFPV